MVVSLKLIKSLNNTCLESHYLSASVKLQNSALNFRRDKKKILTISTDNRQVWYVGDFFIQLCFLKDHTCMTKDRNTYTYTNPSKILLKREIAYLKEKTFDLTL